MDKVNFYKYGLFFVLVLVVGECSRLKRQDLIPSPRIGKRMEVSKDLLESSKAFKNLPLLVRHLQEREAQGGFTLRSRQEKRDGVPFGLEDSQVPQEVIREALGPYSVLQEGDALGWSRREQQVERKRDAPERHTISSALQQRSLQEGDALGNAMRRLRQEEKRDDGALVSSRRQEEKRDDGALVSSRRQEIDALGSSLLQQQQEKENGEALVGFYPLLQRYLQEGDALELRKQQQQQPQQQQQQQQQGLQQETDALGSSHQALRQQQQQHKQQQHQQQQQHGRHNLPQLLYPLNTQEIYL
ncbi:hypothetical protein Pmani_011818 [Petrolisthes manimaculis]|uniref:Uncharacterized protein n=1 Tax=Petrolisthes manimaculis TaxID=1843537 RepID=A0AAE1PZ89_9EUCA|nr:hypothetical protein Pmani_011818 [Petrolisthes manimaculis]